jgi:hypothetical protein
LSRDIVTSPLARWAVDPITEGGVSAGVAEVTGGGRETAERVKGRTTCLDDMAEEEERGRGSVATGNSLAATGRLPRECDL